MNFGIISFSALCQSGNNSVFSLSCWINKQVIHKQTLHNTASLYRTHALGKKVKRLSMCLQFVYELMILKEILI